jgi:flagellar hook-basal body protein
MAQYGIGLSALNAFSEAIDVTSNNIANGQTVGYKQAEYVFADQFFKAQNPQSRDRAGMGTSRMIIRRANTYGTISGTQNPLDLAIAGPGMFMLAKQIDGTVPTENPQKFQYTRNGQFAVDAENRIVNENGLYLVGYAANASGTILDSTKSVLKLDPTPYAQQATKASTISVNLDSRANPTSGGAFDPKTPASYSQTTSQTVYDDKGQSHTLSMFYKKVNSVDMVLTQQAGANTFTFEPKQALGTLLNGEQATTIATTSAAATVTGPIETIYNGILNYVSGGVENITGIKSVAISAVGTGYSPGIYKNVALGTSGLGTGALATVTIAADGTLGSIKITDSGTGYVAGDTITIPTNGSIGGTGLGITLTNIASTNIVGGTAGASLAITKGASGATRESNLVTFKDLTVGQTVTMGGATFTAGALGATAAQVANAFASLNATTAAATLTANKNLNDAAGGTFTSGTFTGWTTSAISSGSTLTFTSATDVTDVPDLENTGTLAARPTVVKTDGAALAATERNVVTFSRDLVAGDSITIGGLTLTATGPILAGAVASAFADLSNGRTGNVVSNGSWSGTLSGWVTGVANGTQVTFTSSTTNANVTDLAVVTNKVGAGTLGATYNLALSDGTNLSIKQITAKGDTAQYKVEVDRFAVFATLDGVSVGQTSTGTGTSTIRIGGTTTQEQTSLGTMAFVGGKNIDSLSRDQFGRPQFNTRMSIDASGGAGSSWGKTANGGTVQFVLDSTNMTGFSSVAQTYENEQDGSATSQLTAYSFDNYGKLVAQYDNGKSVVKGQLVLAAFNNFEGLIPVGGNGYQASALSGSPLIDKPNGSQMGAIRSQSVEESNVDLTQSLVKLMVLQRAYSAASQATKVQVATLIDDTLRIGQ